jgi:hypothetical protein
VLFHPGHFIPQPKFAYKHVYNNGPLRSVNACFITKKSYGVKQKKEILPCTLLTGWQNGPFKVLLHPALKIAARRKGRQTGCISGTNALIGVPGY